MNQLLKVEAISKEDISNKAKMPFTSAWILEFSQLENHTEEEKKMIVGCIEGGMWQVTREDQEVKDSAYWQKSANEYGERFSAVCRQYYAGKNDKRTSKYRLLKKDMSLFNCYTTICELYRLRELKREAAAPPAEAVAGAPAPEEEEDWLCTDCGDDCGDDLNTFTHLEGQYCADCAIPHTAEMKDDNDEAKEKHLANQAN
jgi:hypothetical protein